MLRFELGQHYKSNYGTGRTVEVIQIIDDGRKARIQVRDSNGHIEDEPTVAYIQFAANWSLVLPT